MATLTKTQSAVLLDIVDGSTGKGRRGINPAGVEDLPATTIAALVRKGYAAFKFFNVGRGGVARVRFLRPTTEGFAHFA